MNQQSFANHSRYVKGYHYVLSTLVIMGTIASIVNIWRQAVAHDNLLSAILIGMLFISCALLFYYVRQFPLKAQDRVIRTEENLRYYILTHKQLDNRITMKQLIALRFAPDNEFVVLVDRTINESLSPDEIKRAIKNWRPDNARM